MSKRANDQSEERASKQVRQATGAQPAQKAEDEGMGDFEDQWGDEEESDGEVVEHDAAEDDGNGDDDGKSKVIAQHKVKLAERVLTCSGDDWRYRG